MSPRLPRLAGGIAAAAAVAGAAGLWWLSTALPEVEGRIRLPGLSAEVEIVRDRHGIPSITAASAHDAYFALGFVHAQDRLWQMDFMRRAGEGRLSEILGPAALPHDRLMRTLGLRRSAEAQLAGLSEEVGAALAAYAEGINAYLANHRGAWPLEYYLLRTRPERWRPVHSLLWGRLMALRLSVNFRTELLRAELAQRLAPDMIADLWPPDSGDAARLGDRAPSLARPTRIADAPPFADRIPWGAIAAALPPGTERGASNSWVVDGSQSSTGKPILANDPHLALEAPSVWYLARLEAPGLSLAGASAPGLPFHVIGHNGRVAWAFTSSEIDVQDLFVERLDPSDPGRYLAPGGPRPFTMREETIRVRGAPEERIRVRETRHGPVLSDILPKAADAARKAAADAAGGYVVALSDAGLAPDDRTAQALYRINRARDAAEITSALEDFAAPVQAVTYADRDGSIGLRVAGRVPIRKKGDGTRPVPGAEGDFDWTGFVPFDGLPKAENPASGRIVAANHRLAADDYPYFLGAHWPAPFRARRIGELLGEMAPLAPAEAAAMQLDAVSLAARELLPLLLDPPAADAEAEAAKALLARWDGDMARDRPEPLIYSAWLLELNRAVAADELGPSAAAFRGPDPAFLKRVLTSRPQWCDDVTTAAAETCPQAVARALATALSGLRRDYGAEMSRWRWGAAHAARFRNPALGGVPLLSRLFTVEVPADGDDSTIARGTFDGADTNRPFTQIHGPGLRAVFDLADLDRSLFMIAPGQSGHPLARAFRALARPWGQGLYLLLARGGAGGEAGISRLVLEPARGRPQAP